MQKVSMLHVNWVERLPFLWVCRQRSYHRSIIWSLVRRAVIPRLHIIHTRRVKQTSKSWIFPRSDRFAMGLANSLLGSIINVISESLIYGEPPHAFKIHHLPKSKFDDRSVRRHDSSLHVPTGVSSQRFKPESDTSWQDMLIRTQYRLREWRVQTYIIMLAIMWITFVLASTSWLVEFLLLVVKARSVTEVHGGAFVTASNYGGPFV